MALMTADEVYEQVVRPLASVEKLRLMEKIARALDQEDGVGKPREGVDWMSVRGIAPGLLGGEDAQAWVSRKRAEWDERADQWRKEP